MPKVNKKNVKAILNEMYKSYNINLIERHLIFFLISNKLNFYKMKYKIGTSEKHKTLIFINLK